MTGASPSKPSYLGQRLLLAAILLYRRRLSGRGPLRRVACTFAHTESCSAYGLRAARELARSLPEAVSLIRKRIRACGETSLYRLSPPSTGGPENEPAPALLWGLAFDADGLAHDAELMQRGEQPRTRAAVLRMHAIVAQVRGHGDDRARLTRAALALDPGRSRAMVRDGARLRKALARRLVRSLGLLALVLAAAVCMLPLPLLLALALFAADAACRPLGRYLGEMRRIDRLCAASQFRRPRRPIQIEVASAEPHGLAPMLSSPLEITR